jgi:acetylornithine deacetylase/succinyl-diaminopimelate desuccinylase-like protein
MTRPSAEDIRVSYLRAVEDVKALSRIPSVSADESHRADVESAAQAVADLCRNAGFPVVDIVRADGAPAVIARHPAPAGCPTALLYAHHDVQPAGDVDAWSSPPFEPTERDGRLYGRGTADDKAGIAAHLAAYRAYRSAPPIGITLFIEGEEESGSPSMGRLLDLHGADLAADVIVVADGANWEIGTPAITTSLRGFVDVEVELHTLDHAVHSGMWGGAAPDAVTTLCRLVTTLFDATGAVAVAGLEADPAPALDYPEDRFREESGLLEGVALLGSGSLSERLWAKPALTVLGIDAPGARGASNTLTPSARAKLSLRIAPSQDPAAAYESLTDHLRRNCPQRAILSFDSVEVGRGYSTSTAGAHFDAARDAMCEAWAGRAPVETGMGGSVPIVAELASRYPDASIVISGVEDPDTRAHGIDESLHLAEFERVVHAEIALIGNLHDGHSRAVLEKNH